MELDKDLSSITNGLSHIAIGSKREREDSISEDDTTISAFLEHSFNNTPINTRLKSLNLNSQQQFASKIPTRSPSINSLTDQKHNLQKHSSSKLPIMLQRPSSKPTHLEVPKIRQRARPATAGTIGSSNTTASRSQPNSAMASSHKFDTPKFRPRLTATSQSTRKLSSVTIPHMPKLSTSRRVKQQTSISIANKENSKPSNVSANQANASQSPTMRTRSRTIKPELKKLRTRSMDFSSNQAITTPRTTTASLHIQRVKEKRMELINHSSSNSVSSSNSISNLKSIHRRSMTDHIVSPREPQQPLHSNINRLHQQSAQKQQIEQMPPPHIRPLHHQKQSTHRPIQQFPKAPSPSASSYSTPAPATTPVSTPAPTPRSHRHSASYSLPTPAPTPTPSQISPVHNRSLGFQQYNKISTHKEIYKVLLSSKYSSLFKGYMDSLNYKFQAAQPFENYSELSCKSPTLYGNLNIYERGEIMKKNEIYITGLNRDYKLKLDIKNFKDNFGFDDLNGDYKCLVGDHINYRFEILTILGKGSFGSVLAVKDYKHGNIKALKIIRNKMELSLQAVNEVKFIKRLNTSENRCANIMNYYEHFHFRSHMCIVTELLSVNLFQLIESTNYKGIALPLIRDLSREILLGLRFMHDSGIIHCDLKPENLMLSFNSAELRFQIKIIDFGSTCITNELSFSYLQSRFYRAPEVCLGARYDTKIDIWSFGTIISELFMGLPLFQVKDEFELFNDFLGFFGVPSRSYIVNLRHQLLEEGPIYHMQTAVAARISAANNSSAQKKVSINYSTLLWKGFNSEGAINMKYLISHKPTLRFKPCSKNLKHFLLRYLNSHDPKVIHEFNLFINFLNGCFAWNRDNRFDCEKLLHSDFLKI